ncbi:MAG TPA: hypothetical protein VEL76_32890, partial [Gemmataceae bacterium]|nr:hypothetical protein [Gemmataceae bacterium]
MRHPLPRRLWEAPTLVALPRHQEHHDRPAHGPPRQIVGRLHADPEQHRAAQHEQQSPRPVPAPQILRPYPRPAAAIRQQPLPDGQHL